jgi:hypothetical protein
MMMAHDNEDRNIVILELARSTVPTAISKFQTALPSNNDSTTQKQEENSPTVFEV